jgi:hypothetical protein
MFGLKKRQYGLRILGFFGQQSTLQTSWSMHHCKIFCVDRQLLKGSSKKK